MTRAIRLTCLSLLLVGLAGTAALAKPSIAILGLEVIDKQGTPSAQDTQVAQDLTQGLRERAKAGAGPYQMAVGSEKELIDEKLLKNCDDEKPTCMAAIGNELNAEFLMYGRIEKAGGSYKVSVVLLDVKAMKKEKTFPDVIPLPEATGTALKSRAKKIYSALTGQNDSCTIAVKTSGGADRGTILINGETKGNITNGAGQVSLSEGKYKVAVEAQDYHRFEKADVTCTAGATTNVPADMQKMTTGDSGTGPGGLGSGSGSDNHDITGSVSHPSSTWKPVLIGGAVATGLLAVGFGVSWDLLASTGAAKKGGFLQYGGNCTTNPDSSVSGPGHCSSGSTLKATTYVTGIAAIVAGGVTIVALIKTVSGGGREEHAANGRAPKPAIVVTPVIGPNGAGATLQFDW